MDKRERDENISAAIFTHRVFGRAGDCSGVRVCAFNLCFGWPWVVVRKQLLVRKHSELIVRKQLRFTGM